MSVHPRFIPEPQLQSRHATEIAAQPEQVWPHLRDLDLSDAWLSRILFMIRGLGNASTTADLESLGFRLLHEDRPTAVAWGVIGRPWASKVESFEADEFEAYDTPGQAKISWTFEIEPTSLGSLVSTETRIMCTDDDSLRRFSRYWRFIGPFSGLIRSDMLRTVKRQAEAA